MLLRFPAVDIADTINKLLLFKKKKKTVPCITGTPGHMAPIRNSTVAVLMDGTTILARCWVVQGINGPTTTFASHRENYLKRFNSTYAVNLRLVRDC